MYWKIFYHFNKMIKERNRIIYVKNIKWEYQ